MTAIFEQHLLKTTYLLGNISNVICSGNIRSSQLNLPPEQTFCRADLWRAPPKGPFMLICQCTGPNLFGKYPLEPGEQSILAGICRVDLWRVLAKRSVYAHSSMQWSSISIHRLSSKPFFSNVLRIITRNDFTWRYRCCQSWDFPQMF